MQPFFSYRYNDMNLFSFSNLCSLKFVNRYIFIQFSKTFGLLALLTGASAFAPSNLGARTSTAISFEYGEYDEKLWGSEAKDDVYAKWDPNSPRSTRNFNPYETWEGNSPDASGIFPGESWYKDPVRPDVSYAIMLEEKAAAEQRDANPKPGDVPGAPGCKNKGAQY
jgi:hypothetical protein